jgi:hypothetical protein
MIQYSRDVDVESRGRGVLDTPQEPVIGRRVAPTRWRGMTSFCGAASCTTLELSRRDGNPSGSANVHLRAAKLSSSRTTCQGGDVMERRHFLKLAFGFVAGATALAASAKAAPLPPVTPQQGLVPPRDEAAEPAVVTQDDVDHLRPEEVRWGHHWHGRGHWGHRRHWGWRRRHWGWHRRHWRRHWRRHRW